MRICFIANQVAAWGKLGGVGVNLRRLGGALAAAGHDIHVVVPRRRGQQAVEQLDGMTVHGLSWASVLAGSSIYRQIDADIYHLQEPTLAGYWAQRAMPDRIHLVTSMDPRDAADLRIEFQHATWQRRLKAPAQWLYEDGPFVRHTVQTAHGVYVEAACLREKTRAKYGLKALPDVLPKPIPIPTGPFQKATRPLCVFLARMDPRKCPERFIDIAKLIPEYDFVMVGRAHDATYQRRLENCARGVSNLTLTGFLDPFGDPRLFDLLSRAWVLVHPAQREGLATAFQEASVHEVAILAQVDPGGYVSRFGRVIPTVASATDWAVAVRELIESKTCHDLGRAGRDYNIQHHAIDVSLRCHLEAYARHFKVRSDVRSPPYEEGAGGGTGQSKR